MEKMGGWLRIQDPIIEWTVGVKVETGGSWKLDIKVFKGGSDK